MLEFSFVHFCTWHLVAPKLGPYHQTITLGVKILCLWACWPSKVCWLTKVTSRRGISRRPTTNSQGVRYFSLPNWKALQAVDKSLRVEIELATTMTRVKKTHTKMNLSEKSKLKKSKTNFRLIGGSVQDPAIPGNAKPFKVKAAFWKWKDLRSKTNAQITLNDKLRQIT